MPLNKEDKNLAYNIGRLIAIVESTQQVQPTFASDCITNPLDKLGFHLTNAIKGERGEELSNIIANMECDKLPSFLSAEDKGKAYIGYYHQKSFDDKRGG